MANKPPAAGLRLKTLLPWIWESGGVVLAAAGLGTGTGEAASA